LDLWLRASRSRFAPYVVADRIRPSAGHNVAVKVLLRNPRRELIIDGRRNVNTLLAELGLPRESHLVIRNGTLVPGDADLAADDTVEIRPVISGGC